MGNILSRLGPSSWLAATAALLTAACMPALARDSMDPPPAAPPADAAGGPALELPEDFVFVAPTRPDRL